MAEHVLKCWPEYFDAVERGVKTFEVRRDDRGYVVGDTLILQRTNPVAQYEVDADADGRPRCELRRRVTYVLRGGQFGIEQGFVVLALAQCD